MNEAEEQQRHEIVCVRVCLYVCVCVCVHIPVSVHVCNTFSALLTVCASLSTSASRSVCTVL